MTVIIVGLRRSGTTAFWEMWRQDPRFVGFNEPFNPLLRRVADPAWPDLAVGYREFGALYARDPARFWGMFAPIDRHGELSDGLSDYQRRYLAWLLGQASHVCTDITRAHFKLGDLRSVAPDAVLVHLYRPPRNWVTSVTLPSTGHLKGRPTRERWIRRARLELHKLSFRRSFWSAEAGVRFKGFEDLIGTTPGSAFGLRLAAAGMDPEAVYRMPAVGRLLAFWKLHYDHVEREGAAIFGDRFLSVNFNDFCRSPEAVVASVYACAGERPPPLDVRHIHPPPPPHAPNDPRWQPLLATLGLSDLA